MYYTVRADIKDSSKNLKYKEIGNLLKYVDTNLNKELSNDTLINLVQRGGDEIFGVFKSAKALLLNYALLISAAKIYHVPLYIGIGVGHLDITTK